MANRRGFREGNNSVGYKQADEKGWLRPSHIATVFGINHSSIRRQCELGLFPGAKKNERKEWMIPYQSVMHRMQQVFGDNNLDWEHEFETLTVGVAEALLALKFDVFGEEQDRLLVSRNGVTFRIVIERIEDEGY